MKYASHVTFCPMEVESSPDPQGMANEIAKMLNCQLKAANVEARLVCEKSAGDGMIWTISISAPDFDPKD